MRVTVEGVDEYGEPFTAAGVIPTSQVFAYAVSKLDRGWRALSIKCRDREVAGIQDFGDGHYDAWVDLP